MPAKPLTPEQKTDAARLNARFKARKLEEPGLTQAVMADDLGYSTQSAVSQYLRGEVPLNVEAAIRFANRLGCMVSDFSPTIQQAIDRIASFSSTNNGLMDDAMLAAYQKADYGTRAVVDALLSSTPPAWLDPLMALAIQGMKQAASQWADKARDRQKKTERSIDRPPEKKILQPRIASSA